MEHASFGYTDSAVVHDVSLSVSPGEVVALLGANGSGKSTLVKGILGLNEQLGGEVRLFGVRREDFDEHPRLGYVPQRHTLWPRFAPPSRRSSPSAGSRTGGGGSRGSAPPATPGSSAGASRSWASPTVPTPT